MKRVFAVSDIHGHSAKFMEALLGAGLVDENLNWLDNDSCLVVCGDNIDRGPDSKGVIEMLMKLTKSNRVFALLGNHEAMLIDGLTGTPYWLLVWLKNGGRQTLHGYGMNGARAASMLDGIYKKDIIDIVDYIGMEHITFMQSMLTHAILSVGDERVLFVHAGVDPRKKISELPLADDQHGTPSFLWIREMFYNHGSPVFIKKNYGVDRIVFGHTPTAHMTNNFKSPMEPRPKWNGKILAIDTGSYSGNGSVTIVEILPGYAHRVAASV